MKKLLSAIAAAFRNSVSFVWDKCARTGEWTLKAVAGIAGGGGAAPAAYAVEDEPTPEAAVEFATAADLIQEDDGKADALIKRTKEFIDTWVPLPMDRYDAIKSLSTAIGEGRSVDYMLGYKLSWLTAEWMDCMPQEMHAIVGAASKEDIIAHVKGTKTIRGVLRCDKESIADWKRQDQLEIDEDGPAIDYGMQPAWARGRLAAC